MELEWRILFSEGHLLSIVTRNNLGFIIFPFQVTELTQDHPYVSWFGWLILSSCDVELIYSRNHIS